MAMTSVVKVMMESVLRVVDASFNSASLLMVLENQNGQRFWAGRKDLKQLYLTKGLSARDGDTEITVPPSHRFYERVTHLKQSTPSRDSSSKTGKKRSANAASSEEGASDSKKSKSTTETATETDPIVVPRNSWNGATFDEEKFDVKEENEADEGLATSVTPAVQTSVPTAMVRLSDNRHFQLGDGAAESDGVAGASVGDTVNEPEQKTFTEEYISLPRISVQQNVFGNSDKEYLDEETHGSKVDLDFIVLDESDDSNDRNDAADPIDPAEVDDPADRVFFFKSSGELFPVATWRKRIYKFIRIQSEPPLPSVVAFRCDVSHCSGRISVALRSNRVVSSTEHDVDLEPLDDARLAARVSSRSWMEPTLNFFKHEVAERMQHVMKILMESMIRIADSSFNSASLLLVLETPDGQRCWSGRKALREMYLTEGLTFRSGDTELVVNQADSVQGHGHAFSVPPSLTSHVSARLPDSFVKKPPFNLPIALFPADCVEDTEVDARPSDRKRPKKNRRYPASTSSLKKRKLRSDPTPHNVSVQFQGDAETVAVDVKEEDDSGASTPAQEISSALSTSTAQYFTLPLDENGVLAVDRIVEIPGVFDEALLGEDELLENAINDVDDVEGTSSERRGLDEKPDLAAASVAVAKKKEDASVQLPPSDHVAQEGRVFFYKSSAGKYPMATWKNYSYAFAGIKRRGAVNSVIYRCKHTDVCRGRIHVDLERKCVLKSNPHNFDVSPPDFETFCKRVRHRTPVEPTIETFLGAGETREAKAAAEAAVGD